jgi:flagellar biosynthesis protein FliQ
VIAMDPAILHVGREALLLVLAVSAPPLLAALAVGLVTGVLQAVTQIQEPTVGVVPRLGAVFVALAVAAPWIGARVTQFARSCLDLVPRIAP